VLSLLLRWLLFVRLLCVVAALLACICFVVREERESCSLRKILFGFVRTRSFSPDRGPFSREDSLAALSRRPTGHGTHEFFHFEAILPSQSRGAPRVAPVVVAGGGDTVMAAAAAPVVRGAPRGWRRRRRRVALAVLLLFLVIFLVPGLANVLVRVDDEPPPTGLVDQDQTRRQRRRRAVVHRIHAARGQLL